MHEPTAETLSTAEVAKLMQRQDRMHLVTHHARPGAQLLISAIEWFYFSPRKKLNHLFELTFVKWEDDVWFAISIPKWKSGAVKRLAPQLGMRIADGAPTMLRVPKPNEKPSRVIEGMGVFFFPGALMPDGRDNPMLFSIENDSGSPVYQNCRKSRLDIMSAEGEVVQGFANGVDWTPEKIVEYVYGVPNFVAAKKKRP